MESPKRRLIVYLGLALLLAATFVFRFPSLLEPLWYDDEGIYAAVAHAMLKGSVLYRDVLDNRTPGIYWLYAAMLSASGYSFLFIRLMATLSLLLTQVTAFFIAWRLVNVRAGLAAVALLGLLGSLPFIEGNIANAEIYMILPTTVGMLLLIHGRFYLAGVALSFAFLIKQIAGVELVACVLALLLFSPRPLPRLAMLALGYLTPIAAASAYLLAQGTLGEFIFAGFGYYFGYVQRATRIPHELWPIKLLLLAAAILVLRRFLGGQRSTEKFHTGLLYLWTVFAIFGALFTARPYPHYLLQPLAPVALLIGALVGTWSTPLPRLTVGRVATVTGLSVAWCWLFLAIYMPWPNWAKPEKTVAYYQNFVQFMSGQRSLRSYNDFFDKRVNRNMSLARYVLRQAKQSDYLLIWGEEPWVYVMTRLHVAAPFTVSYYAYEMPSGLDRMVEAIRQRKPAFVIWTTNKPLYPNLKAELEREYQETSLMENAVVYQRSSAVSTVAMPAPLGDLGAGNP
ncbi:MAG: hypothetical protein HYY02_07805 [Chloroflexi bacterium]|nr:hypothetical protein [Chloroflexota bacterium]